MTQLKKVKNPRKAEMKTGFGRLSRLVGVFFVATVSLGLPMIALGQQTAETGTQTQVARVTRIKINKNEKVTLYWLTNTAVSSARLYWESKLAFFAPKGVPIPAAVSAYPEEIYTAPRSWTEKAYPKLIYFNKLPKGGHFAAWEQPEYFVSELRAAFKTLR